MRTDELIAHLSAGLEPAPSRYVGRVLAQGLGLGVLGSALLMLVAMGPRPDLGIAMQGGAFWMKLVYTMSLGALGLWMMERWGRPDGRAKTAVALLAVPVALLAMVAIVQLMAPHADDRHLVLGDSWHVCAIDILTVSIPTFFAVFWTFRKLAPTRLMPAGAAAGLLSGATGASVYAFHCVEYTAPFILVWYTGGIALAAGIGALLGRRVLRW